jgi:hypothetical protein
LRSVCLIAVQFQLAAATAAAGPASGILTHVSQQQYQAVFMHTCFYEVLLSKRTRIPCLGLQMSMPVTPSLPLEAVPAQLAAQGSLIPQHKDISATAGSGRKRIQHPHSTALQLLQLLHQTTCISYIHRTVHFKTHMHCQALISLRILMLPRKAYAC